MHKKEDYDYIPPRNPRLIGLETEHEIIKKSKCRYCNTSIETAKRNNPVYDAYHYCEKSNSTIEYQIKTITTKKDYYPKGVAITKPSIKRTCNTKLKIIKVHLYLNNVYIYSPQKTNKNGKYYNSKINNRWGNPIVEMIDGNMTKQKLFSETLLV